MDKPAAPRLTRRHLLAAALPLPWLGLAGCSKPADPSPPAPVASVAAPAASATRPYVVATDAAYAPFESQDARGEIVGFDIDVMRAVAAHAGFEVRFVNTPWEGIFNALAQGDRDLIISAVTITPQRRETLDFSEPYFDARQLIVTREGSKLADLAGLKGLKVGVQTGTTGDEVVSKALGKGNPDIRRFESTPLALAELAAGGVEAVVADNGVVIHHVANNPTAKLRTVADASFASEQYGIAIRKGNHELKAKVDAGLAAIRADGSYEAIHRKWFGAPAPVAASR